jgi:hypothetical protein
MEEDVSLQWAMRRKRRIATGEAYKWKARLTLHGGKQEYGINFWELYAPVIAWAPIRLYLILAILNKKRTQQIDWVLAFPQARRSLNARFRAEQS